MTTPDWEQRPSSDAPSYEREYRFGDSKLIIRFGDITRSDAEVLVSSDDYLLSAGGGVSLALTRAGGHAVSVDASKYDSLSWGDVAVTSAGALPAKFIFHVVTIGPDAVDDDGSSPRRGDRSPEAQQVMIARATRRCMELATELGVSSLAFPALGAGVANLEIASVAASMAEVIAADLREATSPRRVELFLAAKSWQSEWDYLVFFEEVARHLSVPLPVAAPAEDLNSRSRDVPALVKVQQEVVEVEQMASSATSGARLIDLREKFESTLSDSRPIQVFVSYAREDQEAASILTSHLSALRHENLVVWSDQRIEAGQKWDQMIREAIETADIGVYLVSHWFLSSEYCVGVEWRRAVERSHEGSMRLLPVILSQCHWKSLVGDVQVLPAGGQPITSQSNHDEAYFGIVAEVRTLALALKEARA